MTIPPAQKSDDAFGPSVGRGARRRLTAAEQRLWELETGDAAAGAHVFALAYDLEGPLDVDGLERALQAVAARHVGLRARVGVVDGVVCLEDDPGRVIRLEREPVITSAAACEIRLGELARRRFDLAAGPAWSAALIPRGPGRNTLLLAFHHIVADRWSVAVVVTDLSRAGLAVAGGRPPFEDVPTTDPAAQLAVAETEAPDAATLAAELEWWRRCLTPPPPTLRLPGALSVTPAFDYRGARIESEFDEATRLATRAAGQAHATTAFPVLLTAFACGLSARTGQTDILLCTPVMGRQRAATRSIVGYFNNILPLRLDLSGDPTLAELLERIKAAIRDALTHPRVPLQEIAALPEMAGVRLARGLFAVQNIPGLALKLPGVDSSYRDIPNGTANFDLSLFIEEKSGRFHLLLDYKTALLEPEALKELEAGLCDALRHLAERPETRLSQLRTPGVPAAAEPSEQPARHGGRTQATETVSDASPGSILEARLLEIWRRIFPQAVLDADTGFFELGGDSMDAARLFSAIRKELGHELPLATLFEAPSVRQLVDRLGREDWVAPWMSVVPVRPHGTRTALFCIHGGGGNVLAYRQLAEALGPDRPVYCLQARGLREGDRPPSSVEEMAAHYLEAMRRTHPHGPYLLGGHSLGAVVAYEMALRLTESGESVPFVALLDHTGPDIHLNRFDWFRYHFMNLSMLDNRGRLEYVRNHVRWRFKEVQAKRRLPALKRQNGRGDDGAARDPGALGPISVFQASLLAIKNYRIRPYSGRLTLFRAQQGAPKILSDRYGGWNGMAPGRVEVLDVPGTHMTMMKEPHVRELGRMLGACLEAQGL